MKRMKRLVCCLMALAMIIPAAALAENSWGQINQSLERGADWVRYVENPEAFSLGDTKPLEGQEGLSVAEWGTYPSLDGSTVCVPLAMELARQWLDLAEEDLNGFVNFSTTPNAYDRLTEGKANPTVTIASRGIMMDDTHPVDIVLGTGPNADERLAAETDEWFEIDQEKCFRCGACAVRCRHEAILVEYM